jgi:uncharacterized protein (TIGR02147 family)
MNTYRFSSYKDLLHGKLKELQGQRGIVAKMAVAAGCQRSYLSQVLNTHVHLTPDHAYGLCGFFGFNEDETTFFMLLVDHARAGGRALKGRLKNQIERIQKRNLELEGRLDVKIVQVTESTYRYYSSWIWAAIHIAVSIPVLQTPEQLAKHLQLPQSLVESTLVELTEMGLVSKSGAHWSYAGGEQHLSRRSTLIATHHGNWRGRAALMAQVASDQNYHYTGVSSASRADCQLISDLLLETTERIRKIIAASKEEELICVNLDLFRV